MIIACGGPNITFALPTATQAARRRVSRTEREPAPPRSPVYERLVIVSRRRHMARHRLLHGYFDELLSDYLACNQKQGKGLENTTIEEFMRWSHRQTVNPEEPDTEE